MTAWAYTRGHKVIYDEFRDDWYYADTFQKVDDKRPCPKCGLLPTPKGYDACLGHLPGVRSACCGHGVEESYIMKAEWQQNFDKRQLSEIEFCRLYAKDFAHDTDGHNGKMIIAKMADLLDRLETDLMQTSEDFGAALDEKISVQKTISDAN